MRGSTAAKGSGRSSLLTTSRPLLDGDRVGNAPAEADSIDGRRGSSTMRGSETSRGHAAARRRSRRSRRRPRRTSRRTREPHRTRHTARTDHPRSPPLLTERLDARGDRRHAVHQRTRSCALAARARVRPTPGPSPSPTRAFYVVSGQERDNEERRSARADFVSQPRSLVIADKRAPEQTRALVDALQSLRGVARLTAVTVVTELGSPSRFERAAHAMSYTGLVPSEHSSGKKNKRGAITKTGNSHLRGVLVESAFHYRHPPKLVKRQREMQQSLSPQVAAMAWKAQQRLHRRYWLLTSKSKPKGKVVAAVARELIGFIWAIAKQVEADFVPKKWRAAA